MAAPTKTSVSKLLDKYERAICLELAGHKCEACGRTDNLSWAHIVKRGRKALAWDRANSLILCYKRPLYMFPKDMEDLAREVSCHYRFDNLMTDRMRYRFVNKLRPDVYDHLDAQIGLKFELTLRQMLELLERKKSELKELRNGAK